MVEFEGQGEVRVGDDNSAGFGKAVVPAICVN